jgi:hypothetical protein
VEVRRKAAALRAAAGVAAVAWALPAPARAMSVRAEPAVLRLGEHGAATLRVEGTPVGVVADDVELRASVGSVTKLEVVGAAWRARYEPPAERSPAVAVVSARVRGRTDVEPAWTAIPLWGRAEIAVATEPAAVVSVTIGVDTYGPFRAPRTGRFSKLFPVPPGVRSATVRSVDALGNARTDEVALDPLPFPPGLLLPRADATLRAGPATPVELVAFLVDETGAPRAEPPSLDVSGGSGALVPGPAPGVFHVRVSATATPFGGTLVVRVGAASPVTLEWRADVAPAAPARVVLEPPPELRAGADAAIAVRVLTAEGAPLAGIAGWITLAPTWGEVGVVTEDAPGVYRAVYRGGGRLPASGEAKLEAAVTPPDAPAVRGEAVRPVRAGAPVRLDVAPPPPVAASRGLVVALRVDAHDAYGNGVDGLAVSARAAAAAVASIVPVAGAPGRYEGALRLGGLRPGRVDVEVDESGGLSARTGVDVTAVPRRWRGVIDAFVMGSWNRADATAAGLALHAGAGTGHALRLSVGAGGYAAWVHAADATGASAALALDAALVEVVARAELEAAGDRWRAGVAIAGGGGLLLGRVRSRAPAAGAGRESGESSALLPAAALLPALRATAEVGVRAGPGWLMLEGGYALRPLPGGLPIRGDLGGPLLALGWKAEL